MFSIELLPAGCGDCLWIEYGAPGKTQIVLIDGGVSSTIGALERRIAAACRGRGTDILDIELLVVTHIDNDHIEGVLELLESKRVRVRPRDVWFNGRSQLIALPARDPARAKARRGATRRGDFLGEGDDDDEPYSDDSLDSRISPADLLGPAEGDRLSELITRHNLPWNSHATWQGNAVVVPESGTLPVAVLDGGLKLTLLGPTMEDLYRLSAAWPDVLGGSDEPDEADTLPDDFLGRSDTWPPAWSDKLARDASKANGSSIMLLADYDDRSLLLAADGHAPALADALSRLQQARGQGDARIPIDAFKVAHHGSSKNVSRAVLERMECSRYLISTDGSKHRHPDHQTMLRILRYSARTPSFFFNYASDTTTRWGDDKSDVTDNDFQDYKTIYPSTADAGVICRLSD